LTLTTLVVCEAGAEKLAQIEALVTAQNDLSLAGNSKLNESMEKIRETNANLVWIELTPNPDQGIRLLTGLKEKFPQVHCLVSNEELDADLVKLTMQSGAVDFLDSKTWSDQLPDVIARIKVKEQAAVEARERQEAEREKIRQTLETQKIQPTVSKTNLQSMKKMRTDSKEIESRAVMNLALLIVVVLLAAGGAFFFMQGGH